MLSQGIKIHFAHRTFSWSNEARGKAAVHCVIIGFGLHDVTDKTIYEYEDIKGEPHAIKASNINPYLVDAQNLVLSNINQPICKVNEVIYGSFALDDGNYTLTADEANRLAETEPESKKFIKPFIGGLETVQISV